MKSNAGKATKSRTQHKSASSSTKSKRSPKSSVSGNSESAAAQLDGVVDRTGNATAESEAGDRILKETGIAKGAAGDDLPSGSVELTNSQQSTVNSQLEPWNPADFGELHHVAEANGQLNLLDWTDKEPPEPDDYSSIELFDEAYKQWVDAQTDEAEEELANFGVEELKSNQFKAWLQTEEGKTKAAEFGVTIEPPDPNDYEFPEQFEGDYKNWVAAQPDENLANFEEVETWNQLMDGSICVAESESASPMPESNFGNDRLTTSASGMITAEKFLGKDTNDPKDLSISEGQNLTSAGFQYSSSLLPRLALHSQSMESDSEPAIQETASPTCSEQSTNCDPTLQSSKTLPASSLAPTPLATNPEPTSDLSSTPYPRAGTMRNGLLSAAPTLPPPGVESESLLLRSPGGLSSGEGTRPPGKSRLETQLNQLELIQDGEVAAPEFLEVGFDLPTGWTNPQEKRTALELAQVQVQQLPIAPSSESQAEIQTTAIEEQPWAMPLTGELQQLPLSGLNISSVSLPDNIGSFTKEDLLEFAIAAHRSISDIQKSELELAMRKLNQARIAGTCLAEYKKKCRHGEFEERVSAARINVRTAQTYMSIAKNWDLLAEASRETVLEDGQILGINWGRDTIAQSKKSLKSAAAPANPDDWRTPNTKEQPIINLVKQALGGQIWCDPCADAGHKVGAAVAFHKGDDGLKDVNIWRKTVFVNPPFSDPLPWVKKCCFSITRGDCSAAIMLMKAGTLNNQGTGNLIEKYASAVCHWRGRINFLNDEGVAVKGSDFDCVLVYFGDRLDLFKKAFEQRGTITTIQNRYSSVNNKHIAAATVPVVEEVQEVPAIPATITSVKEEQEVMAADFGLRTNGKTLLPDVAVNDRAKAEQLDPYTVDDRPFAIQVESVEADDSKWYEETAIGVVSRTEGFTTNQSAEIINKLLKADFKSRTRATLKKLSKEELTDLLRYCDQELDNRK
jgi:hypothetical protein